MKTAPMVTFLLAVTAVSATPLRTRREVVSAREELLDLLENMIDAPEKRDVCKVGNTKLTKAQQDAIVAQHNKARKAEGAKDMKQMKWDATVAKVAQGWANQCNFNHGNTMCTVDGQKKTMGQNMWQGTGSSVNPTGIVGAWVAEKADYSYANDLNAGTLGQKAGKTWQDVGHYTQVVWSKSEYVGCGAQQCSGKTIVVCNYFPAGNFPSSVAFKKTGDCPSGYRLRNGLCRSKREIERELAEEEEEAIEVQEKNLDEPLVQWP